MHIPKEELSSIALPVLNQRPTFPCYKFLLSPLPPSPNLPHQPALSSVIHIFIQEPTKNSYELAPSPT